jgi:YrbI family 3-deoxy-D-manno-octulosonate 8-phosphate phosphatase
MTTKLDKFHTIVFDFDGVFTDNFVYVDENAIESVRFSRADGYALDLLRKFCKANKLNISIFILSSERNSVVLARAKKLQIECIYGASNKLEVLKSRFKSERPLDLDPFSGLVYFGNDLNDLPVILQAGMSFAPLDAHSKVKVVSKFVLTRPGGQDFVREGVEFLIGIESMSPEELSEFISNS